MKGTTSVELFTCPACRQPVSGSVSIEMEIPDLSDSLGDVTASGKITGVRVQHDCVPKTTRSSSPYTGNDKGCFT